MVKTGGNKKSCKFCKNTEIEQKEVEIKKIYYFRNRGKCVNSVEIGGSLKF